MALERSQVERWLVTGETGNREIVAWAADPANQADPLFPVLSQIAAGLQEGTLWLRWVALKLRLAELARQGQAVNSEVAAVTAALAQLPDPTATP